MSRRIWIPVAAVVALALLGGTGAYVYFFSGLRTAPSALTLPSPTPTTSSSATASPSASTAASGNWKIGSGSVAGYRVTEQFAGQSSTHEAVARTDTVSGDVTISESGGAFQLTSAKIAVQLSSLVSVDSVAGFNVTNRDRIVQQALEVGFFPTAVFEASNISIPAGAANGQTVTLTVPGQLTVHGVTKNVTATLQLRVAGTTAQIAGKIPTNMTEFGINPPTAPFVTVQPGVTIEVSLNLTKSS
jgi:polyisoprenoid-binding protein YceI